jgi:hypothetical protein
VPFVRDRILHYIVVQVVQAVASVAKMATVGAHAASSKSAIESHRVQNICRLRAAVRGKRLIRSPVEIRIFKVDIAEVLRLRLGTPVRTRLAGVLTLGQETAMAE